MSSNLTGVLWALLSTASFATAAAFAKMATEDYHVWEIVFIRQVFVFLSVLPAIVQAFPNRLKTKRPGWHAFRLLGSTTGLLCSFWAVSQLPLPTAATLTFTSTFFVSIFAWWLLGERFGLPRMIAILVGFGGVIVVVRPGLDLFADTYSLIAVTGALGLAIAMTCMRSLAQTESTVVLIAYQAIFIGALSIIALPFVWITPTLEGFLLMSGVGVTSILAQYTVVKSLRAGEAGVIASIEYMKLIYATTLGFVLFATLPDIWTLAGAFIIIGAALFTVIREARSKAAKSRKSETPQKTAA